MLAFGNSFTVIRGGHWAGFIFVDNNKNASRCFIL